MKIVANASPNITAGQMVVSEMGISKKREHKLLKAVRDTIYQDKAMAVVREYANNACDEHNKFQIARPVEIGLREVDGNLEYFARDFAKGLSDDGIRKVFAMSGESTKDDSDDDIGGFGIGAKCGLCYGTKTFYVHSYFEGFKRTYCFTLGANEDGQETGLVYGLGDPEPTSETGLEVVVPVNLSDKHLFINTINRFIAYCPHNIKADVLGVEAIPNKPVYEKKIGDYNFRLLPSNSSTQQEILFQMGGNTYEKKSFQGKNGEKIKRDHCLVVNIPIGRCSVILSREGFEQTETNTRVFEEIQDILDALVIEDLAQFKTKNTLELVEDKLSDMSVYAGDLFQAYPSQIYQNIWPFVKNVSKSNNQTAETKNSKPICVVIPHNDARNYWIVKVRGYLNDTNKCMYVVQDTLNWKYDDPEIINYFSLVCARKLPYPKVPKIKGRFVIYRRNRKVGDFNTLELFNHVSQKNSWNFTATTEKEAQDYLAQKKKTLQDRHDLIAMSVKSAAYGKDNDFWMSNSHEFLNELSKLGFVNYDSHEYKTLTEEFNRKEREQQAIQSILNGAKTSFVRHNVRTQEAIKKVRHAQRMAKFWQQILVEPSLRAKILKKFKEHHYHYSAALERHELRKVLKLA